MAFFPGWYGAGDDDDATVTGSDGISVYRPLSPYIAADRMRSLLDYQQATWYAVSAESLVLSILNENLKNEEYTPVYLFMKIEILS